MHVPPRALASARQAAIAPIDAGRKAPRGTKDALRMATAEEIDAEMRRLFGSVSGGSLLLTGAISDEAASSLASVVSTELQTRVGGLDTTSSPDPPSVVTSVSTTERRSEGARERERAGGGVGEGVGEREGVVGGRKEGGAPGLPSTAVSKTAALRRSRNRDVGSVEEELIQWSGLLYKPIYSSLAQNSECLDPAIAVALDQCGGI